MRLLRYMTCRADNYREDVWKPCARKSRLPVKRVARCAAGKRGEKLLERDAAIGHKLEINGTPTFLINNRYKVSGGIASKVERELCKRNKTLPGC